MANARLRLADLQVESLPMGADPLHGEVTASWTVLTTCSPECCETTLQTGATSA